MPVDIKELTEGWLELESDPGLFTLLLEDFGVKGVQVEEIYDLNKPLDGPVYGFIFLFRWMEERRSRRKVVEQTEVFVKDEEIVNNIFFAQQMVPNSCATHALISILLNCPNIHLGETLSRLKAHTHGMAPDNKGWAIGNTPELACAHNSHAMPQAKRRLDKGSGVSTGRFTGEAFHFVSFVPINGRLFELDGLKPFPIDHGPWNELGDWTEKFRSVMSDRLGIAAGEQCDIRFNLMAVVPDRRLAITHKLKMLKTNRQIVLDALQHLMKLKHAEVKTDKENAAATTADVKKETVENKPETKIVVEQTATNKQESEGGHQLVTIIEPKNVNEQQQPQLPKQHQQQQQHKTTEEAAKGKDKVMLCPLDYSTPLTIQTSPAPSTSSTETSSEMGSAFNSPTQAWNWATATAQNSPTSKDYKRFVVIRVSNEQGGEKEKTSSKNVVEKKQIVETAAIGGGGSGGSAEGSGSTGGDAEGEGGQKKSLLNTGHARVKTSDGDTVVAEKKSPELLEPHTFAPQDLLALLRNLENEICICEINLKDENDKLKKFQIDDCRRTHNYDDFICTFLSMLAEQGKLADLVEQHLLVPKRPGTVPVPKTAKTKKESKKKRGRSKVKRRK